ncbi:MAG: mandelate racemase [Acidimicrobiia bacterium]|nr:mandelate racemase [Acidimicrobiia bacterium]
MTMPTSGGNATIVSVESFVVDLPSKRQMVLAGGSSAPSGGTSPRVLTKVTDSDGVVGWGESRGNPRWNEESIESVQVTLDTHLAPAVVGTEIWDLDGLHQRMDRAIRGGFGIGHPVAKAGIDVAIHDLLGHKLEIPVTDLLGGRRRDTIQLGWIVSSTDPAAAASEAKEGLEEGYSAFKVKIGVHGVTGDIAFVRSVREVIGDDAFLWVDANQGYTADEALRVARGIVDLDVDVFEQPVAANDIIGLRRLVASSPIPVALDETLRAPRDLVQMVALEAADVVIAKVQRTAGLWRSRQLCDLAEAAGLRIMGSGMSETDIGLAAGLHLFSRYGIDTPVDLNGRQFIETPFVGETVVVDGGVATVPVGPGLGVEVDEEAVRSLSRSN